MLRDTQVVTVLLAITQIAGLLRTMAMAALFGASGVVDAYNLALLLPSLLASVSIGWLQVGFTGRYVGLRLRSPDIAASLRTFVGGTIILFSGTAAGLLILIKEPLSAWLLPSFASQMAREQTATAIGIVAWCLVPWALSDYIALVLNCHKRFLVAAMAPIANGVLSTLVLWMSSGYGLEALGWTLVLGWAIQLAILLFAHAWVDKELFRIRLGGVGGELISSFRAAVPATASVILASGSGIFVQLFCSHFGEGRVAVYGYALKLHLGVSQIFVTGVSTVLLGHLSVMIAAAEREAIVILFRRLVRVCILVSCLVLSGVLMLGRPTVSLLLGHGRFNESLSEIVAWSWFFLSLSLLPLAFGTFMYRLYQAYGRAISLLVASFLGFIATILTCYLALALDNFYLLMGAPVVGQAVQLLYFLSIFKRDFYVSLLDWNWLRSGFVSVALVLPAIVVDLFVRNWISQLHWFLAYSIRAALFMILLGLVFWIMDVRSWLGRLGRNQL